MVGRRGMGVVGVAATAKVVSNRTQAQAEQKAAQQEAVVAPPATAPASAGEDMIAQLEKLAGLKAAGVLSEEEFTAAKAKLISGS
ncbi:MAG: SHOCT domain-containing protein [Actinomycetia bacterium]|nr:SHOCT domain-containing protein [Actinomycetes bacterium]